MQIIWVRNDKSSSCLAAFPHAVIWHGKGSGGVESLQLDGRPTHAR